MSETQEAATEGASWGGRQQNASAGKGRVLPGPGSRPGSCRAAAHPWNKDPEAKETDRGHKRELGEKWVLRPSKRIKGKIGLSICSECLYSLSSLVNISERNSLISKVLLYMPHILF